MQVEHLQAWQRDVMREEFPEPSEWVMVVRMIQAAFRAKIRSALWVHFMHRHVQDTVVILEKGTNPLSRCPKCDMFVTWRALDGRQQVTAM